jgi:hypothetical protein
VATSIGHVITSGCDDMDDILSEESPVIDKLIKYSVIFAALTVQLRLDWLKPTLPVSVELKYEICLIAVN